VSAHFLLPDPADKPYLSSKLKVYALVNTSDRAWHAGQSYWAGKTGLNDQSIGIEIVNLSGCNTDIAKLGNSAQFGTACQFVPFRDEQIVLLTRLLKELLKQYPDIKPESVVGHADIAPSRKVDPGPLFPWKTLHDAGIGAWFDESRASELVVLLDQHPLTIRQQQVLLAAYGYDLSITGLEDERSQLALRAFQMHFRPANYSGFFDNESTARLISLLERYRPRVLASLDDFPAALHTQQQ
jgi:N-acetylmuramoyl-L-alanine amidase